MTRARARDRREHAVPRQGGFTILESLVVLGVLVIMTMMIIALWLREDAPAQDSRPAMEVGRKEATAWEFQGDAFPGRQAAPLSCPALPAMPA